MTAGRAGSRSTVRNPRSAVAPAGCMLRPVRMIRVHGARLVALTLLAAGIAAPPAAGTATGPFISVGAPKANESVAGVYFTTFPGAFDAPGDTFKVRPRALQMSGDASWIIGPMRWTSWGGTTARGTGTSDVETCEPNCASGGILKTTSQVTLSKLGSFHGRRVYRCISVSSHGGSSFARRRAAVSQYCPL